MIDEAPEFIFDEILTPKEIQNFFNEDFKLCKLALSDNEISDMYVNKCYQLGRDSNYVGVRYNGHIVGLLKFEWFTTIAINCHLYITSRLQKSEHVRPITNLFINYLKNDCPAQKSLVLAPTACQHIIDFAPKYGYKKEGQIKQAMIWRKEPCDLVIFNLDISGENKNG